MVQTRGPVIPKSPELVPSAYSGNIKLNYVRTRDAVKGIVEENIFDAADYGEVRQATQYLDGLGRPLQTVMRKASPGVSPKDMVMPVTYDAFGREVNKYLPYVQATGSNTSDGNFKLNPFGDQDNFYKKCV